MLISIIIPVYQSKTNIEKSVRSVLDQTYSDLEIIIVDDCGQDGSIDIIKRVLNDYPSFVSRVRFIHHEHNRGCAAARRSGMQQANGDYILHVDSDDYIAPTMVEKMVRKAQELDADMVVTNYYYWYSSGNVLVTVEHQRNNVDFAKKVLLGNIHAGVWNKLIRTSIIKDNEVYPVPGINMGDDLTILLKALYYIGKIGYIDEPLYYYNRQSNDCISRTNYPIEVDVKLINYIAELVEKYNDEEIEAAFSLFKTGRFGRNLLYNNLNDVKRNQTVFGVSSWKQGFKHKRLPLHYKLVLAFYLNGFNIGVKMIRALAQKKKNQPG